MGAIEAKLAQLGLALPRPMAPPPGVEFPFSLVRVAGSLAYVSGHGPADGDDYLQQGKLGDSLSVQQGYDAARLSALCMLASLKQTLGDLDRVRGWLRVVGYVNCVPGFAQTFAVVNGFSDLILELWGEPGRHARAAPGVAALPFNVPVVRRPSSSTQPAITPTNEARNEHQRARRTRSSQPRGHGREPVVARWPFTRLTGSPVPSVATRTSRP